MRPFHWLSSEAATRASRATGACSARDTEGQRDTGLTLAWLDKIDITELSLETLTERSVNITVEPIIIIFYFFMSPKKDTCDGKEEV